jgi:hypothetical protein
MQVSLREVAFSRAGDKGDTNNVMVAPYDERDYDWLLRNLTLSLVESRFRPLVRGTITRYELPGPRIINFVMERALDGGVSRTINLDAHGKSRASLMLSLMVECQADNLPPSGRGITI